MALGGEHLRCDCPVEACCWSQMGAKSVLASLGSKGPLIQAVEAKSTARAVKQRQQATPYEHKHVTDLMARFRDPEDCEERFAVGFLLLLAFGVLHFHDLHRCKSVKLSRNSIYGTCWRSKNKRGQFPWTALREPNDGLDFGQMMLVLIERYVGFVEGEHGSLRGWLWPHMTITSEGLKITTLPRQGSYGNCLRVQSLIPEKLGHPEQFTLHSPKFYMPTLAGQVGLSLEERNQMCHWKALRAGFAPGVSFELPKPGLEQEQQLQHLRQQQQQSPKWVENKTQEAFQYKGWLLLNHKSGTVYKASGGGQTPCSFVRNAASAHFELVEQTGCDGHAGVCFEHHARCPRCWKPPAGPQLPEWDGAEDLGSESSSSSSSTRSCASSESVG